MSRWIALLVAAALSLATVGVLWRTAIPLGIPSEWVWPRLPADGQSGWNLLLAALTAVVYLVFVALGGRRLSSMTVGRAETAAWLVGLFVAGMMWLWTVQETAPSAGQLAKAPFILYYPSSSGYFTKVRYEAPQVGPFLRDYETFMKQGEVLHVGTHPPGLFLFYQGLIAVTDRCPGLLTAAWSTAPESVREATTVVQENTRLGPQPFSQSDAALLWLTGLIVMALTAATMVPLYGILRLWLPREAAFLGAAFWPTIPAAAIFWPKSDAAFPFLSASLVWCAFTGWTTQSRLRAAASGLALFLGMSCSLAFLPLALFVSLVIGTLAIRDFRTKARSYRRVIVWSLCGLAGFLVPVLLLSLTDVIPLERIWIWNYRNHAGFYEKYSRTYWQWLLVNPIELVIAVGAPLAVLALVGACRGLADGAVASSAKIAVLAGSAVWGLLWLTGKNSGEAARLWVLFMPGLVALAAAGLTRPRTESNHRPNLWPILWLALQLGVAILTVHRVGGFHFEAF